MSVGADSFRDGLRATRTYRGRRPLLRILLFRTLQERAREPLPGFAQPGAPRSREHPAPRRGDYFSRRSAAISGRSVRRR